MNKRAKQYYRLSLIVKAMHSLHRQVDKAREVSQILVERNERNKAKHMKLWLFALSLRRKERQAITEMKMVVKRQFLFRMRVFLRV
jgi:hypothetical protein